MLRLTERELWGMMCILFGLSMLAAVLSFWWPDLKWPATICALLAMHSSTAAQAVGRIKDMQARIDMMRIARGEQPE
jgi:hypothetical protein